MNCLSFIMYYILLINVDLLLLFLIETVLRVISIIFISDTYNRDLLDVNFGVQESLFLFIPFAVLVTALGFRIII